MTTKTKRQFAIDVAEQIMEFPILNKDQIVLMVWGMLQSVTIVESDNGEQQHG